ncbi:hypothetical protein DFH09DRAFT_1277601 [Mycena vulgaris]|nr:hypothetical protein DFH09DRAFT_1277601 [Mycena vulgaris]
MNVHSACDKPSQGIKVGVVKQDIFSLRPDPSERLKTSCSIASHATGGQHLDYGVDAELTRWSGAQRWSSVRPDMMENHPMLSAAIRWPVENRRNDPDEPKWKGNHKLLENREQPDSQEGLEWLTSINPSLSIKSSPDGQVTREHRDLQFYVLVGVLCKAAVYTATGKPGNPPFRFTPFSFICGKGANHSMLLPSLAALGGSPKPEHLRLAL